MRFHLIARRQKARFAEAFCRKWMRWIRIRFRRSCLMLR